MFLFCLKLVKAVSELLHLGGQPSPTRSDLDWYMKEVWAKAELALMKQLENEQLQPSDYSEGEEQPTKVNFHQSFSL